MDDTQLRRMSIKELRELRNRVDEAREVVERREKSELVARMTALAAEHGVSLSDLLELPASTGDRKRKAR